MNVFLLIMSKSVIKAYCEYLENGDFILTMNVRSSNELVSWILSFKGAAEVLEPAEIRQTVLD